MHGKYSRNGNSLLLSAGQLIRRIFPKFIHSHCFQAFLYPLPDFLCGDSHIFRSESHILFHNLSDNLVVRVLEHHPGCLPDIPEPVFLSGVYAIHPDSSLRGIKNCIDMLRQCGLPGTIMSQNGNKIPLLNIHAHMVYRCGDSLHISFFVPPDIFKYNVLCLYNFHFIPISACALRAGQTLLN